MPTWLRALLSLTVLGFLLAQVELQAVGRVLVGARPEVLALLLVMFFAERGLAAVRWHLLIRTQSLEVPFGTTLRATFLSGFLGNFLPGGVGVEAMRVFVMQRATADLPLSLASVLLDRVLGFLALIGIVLVALSLTADPMPPAFVLAVWGLFLLGLGFLALLHPRVLSLTRRVAPVPRAGSLYARVVPFVRSLSALRDDPRVLVRVGILSVVFQCLRVGIAPVAALALGIEAPLVLFLVYVPIILFLMMLPISLGGLGVREAGFLFFFGSEHMTPEAALALGLLIGVLGIVSQLPGAWFLITGVRAKRRRHARNEAER